MRAIRFYGINDLRLDEIPRPISDINEILLKTASVGICGSDVHYFSEGGTGGIQFDRPLILGHEFSAYVAEGSLRGRLVAVDPAIPCGECEFCLEGNPNLCINIRFAGADDTDGALQEFITWPKQCLFLLPEGFTPQQGAMLEPLGVAMHALRLGKVFPGMNVGVFGTGSIGLLTIQMAKLAGASRIFATDKISHRLEYAQECGATDILLADGDESTRILSATKGRGLDVTFEAAGDDGSAVETAVQSAKNGATTVLIGIPSGDITSFTASAARRKGLTIKLSRRMKNTYPTAISLIADGKIDLKSLITHRFAFKDYQQAFKVAAQRQGVKVFIDFD
jgi:L-iditol 2-dehydrogenase